MTVPREGEVWVTRNGRHEGIEVVVKRVTAGGNVTVQAVGGAGASWNAGKSEASGPATISMDELQARYVPKAALVTDPRGTRGNGGKAFRRVAPVKDRQPVPAVTIRDSAARTLAKPANSDPNFEILEVTPIQAAAWLKKGGMNRKISNTRITMYASVMRRGEWQMTAEPVKLAEDGTVRDGQHRLSAIVEAGVPVRMTIARNVPASAFDVMDTGKSRSRSDILSMHGYEYSEASAATARILISLAMSGRPRLTSRAMRDEAPITNASVLRYMEDHADVVDAVRAGYRTFSHGVKGGPGLWAAAYVLFRRIDMERALAFEEGVTTGAGLSAGSPILVLRNNAMQAERSAYSSEPSREVLLAKIIKAWNAYRTGKTVRILHWRGVESEGFPEPV